MVVAPEPGLDTQISLVAGSAAACDTLQVSCVGGANNGAAGAADTAIYTNTTATTQTVFAIIDTASVAPTANFSITATVSAIPDGDTCANATPIAANGALDGTTVGFANDYANGQGCAGISSADRVYSVQLAPNQRLTASVQPTLDHCCS